MNRIGLVRSACLVCVLTASVSGPVRAAEPSEGLLTTAVGGSRGGSASSLPVSRVPATPLTLRQCIEIALANNPQVAQRRWDAQVAEAQRDVAAAQRWPSLEAVGGYRRYLDDQRLVAARKPSEVGTWSSDIFSGDLVVSMPLFAGGRIVNEIRAADLASLAARHQLARTRSEVVFNVSSAFYTILGQKSVIESLEFSQKTLQEHARCVTDLIAVQKAAAVDLLRTEVRLADVEQKLVSARNRLAVQHRVLAALMGIPDAGDGLEVSGSLTLEPVDVEGDPIELALARRDDLGAARAEVEAQARRLQAARGARWPSVSLSGSYGERWAAGDVTRQPGSSESEDVGSVGVSVTLPLFEGGRISAAIRRERARLASAREALRKAELQVRLDVQTALLNMESSRERVRSTEKAIEQARESLRIEREKYELGKGSITDVLDAQSALLDAETTHALALADYNISVAQYWLAVGEEK